MRCENVAVWQALVLEINPAIKLQHQQFLCHPPNFFYMEFIRAGCNNLSQIA